MLIPESQSGKPPDHPAADPENNKGRGDMSRPGLR